MGVREGEQQFETEAEAQEYADRKRQSAIRGYSEVYVTGPYNISGAWMVKFKEYYG